MRTRDSLHAYLIRIPTIYVCMYVEPEIDFKPICPDIIFNCKLLYNNKCIV